MPRITRERPRRDASAGGTTGGGGVSQGTRTGVGLEITSAMRSSIVRSSIADERYNGSASKSGRLRIVLTCRW